MGDVQEDEWLAMDEPIQELFLKSWKVIGNVLAFSHSKGVVTMGKDKGRKMLLIGEEVAAMNVGDGNLVFSPQGFAARLKNNNVNSDYEFGDKRNRQSSSWSTSHIAP